jgi:O-antigen/teichoic acid export membrane protein
MHDLAKSMSRLAPWRLAGHWSGDALLSRVLRNAGRLFGGHAIAGLLALGALALSARTLGSEAFGILMLIHAYALVVGNLTTFKAWHAVVRYGAICIERDRHADLQGLISYALLLDLGSGLAALALAVLGAPWLGPWFGWAPDAVAAGQWYCLVILFMGTGTPTGVLRLFGRFDTLALQRLIAPAVRLLGALAAMGAGGGLRTFLLIWFVAAACDGATLWLLGWRELARRGLASGLRLRVRGIVAAHPGLWRLVWATNLNSTLGAVSGRLSTLVVGAVLDATAAGLYQVAVQFASALERPMEMLRSAIYPEFARLHAASDLRRMRQLGIRAAVLFAGAAVPVLLALSALGEPLLRLTVGEAFVDASGLLTLLIVGLAINAIAFPASSLLIAQGRPGALLALNLVITATYIGLLILLLGFMGLTGAGIAAVSRAAAAVLLTGGVAGWYLAQGIRSLPKQA